MNSKLFAPALVGLLLGSACAQPWSQREPLDVKALPVSGSEWRETERVILVTDGSDTMVKEATFPEAKALTRSFARSMPALDARAKTEHYEAGNIGFGGDERMGGALGPYVPENLVAHTDQLHPLGAGAGAHTPIDDVLGEVAGQLAGGQGRAAVVIFSDGLPNSASAALGAGRALVSGYADGVCVHTVHTGRESAGRSFLKQLADLSACGSARSAGDLTSADAMYAFQRTVFLAGAPAPAPPAPAPAPAPPVADECGRRIVLRGVTFAFDRAEISEDSEVLLDVAAEQLRACESVNISVVGHTCSIGTDAYNQGLSERRAAAVRGYLTRAGVAAGRLDSRGEGEANPVASNDSRDGRAQNRRVELTPR